MIYSIKDFSNSQIEKLRQCPGVKIDMDEGVAEVPFMAEGFFSAVAGKKKQSKSQIDKNPSQPFDKLLKDPRNIRLTNKELQKGGTVGQTNINEVTEGSTNGSPDCNTLGDKDSEHPEEKKSFYQSANDALES